jgi:hypothetical protein
LTTAFPIRQTTNLSILVHFEKSLTSLCIKNKYLYKQTINWKKKYKVKYLSLIVSMKNKVLSWLVVLSYIFMIAMNGLSNTGFFWWRTMQELAYVPWWILVPASYTFSIWGIIFLGLGAFSIYQLRKDLINSSIIATIRPLVIVNFILNWLRLPAVALLWWTWTSGVIIIAMRFSLAHINKYLQEIGMSNNNKRFMITPMSIYFAWITIATPLNRWSIMYQIGYIGSQTNIIRVLSWIWIAYITSIVCFRRLKYISFISVLLRGLLWIISARMYDKPELAWIAVILLSIVVTYIILRSAKKKVIIA